MDALFVTLAIIIVFLFPFFAEVVYIFRVGYIFLWKWCKKRYPLTKQVTSYGVYLPNVVEFNKSNHAWFLRTIEYNRLEFLSSIGIQQTLRSLNDYSPLSALAIYYRKPLCLFDNYEIKTKLSYWKDKDYYTETQIEAINDHSKGVVCFSKFTCKTNSFENVLKSNVQLEENIQKLPKLSKELKTWIDFNLTSSKELKNQKNKNMEQSWI